MHRTVIPPHAVQDDMILIDDPQTVHHLVRVLRVKPGDQLECLDGQGHVYRGTITCCARSQLTVAIERQSKEPPARLQITLAQALIKPQRFEWVIEKATELGVVRVIPMVTSRTTIRFGSGREAHRVERWRRIAESAAAQCGRATLPAIQAPQLFRRVLEQLSGRYALLPTLAEESESLARALRGLEDATEAVILVGPEGDFSPAEVALAKRQGAHTTSLGRLTLRSETAAIATLTILQHTAEVL